MVRALSCRPGECDVKTIHLPFQPEITWGYRVLNRLNSSKSPALKAAARCWPGEVAVAFATKLAVLRNVVQRVNQDGQDLRRELQAKRDMVDRCPDGYALGGLGDHDLFRFAADVDSFIYESRSAYEILRRFIVRCSSNVLGKKMTGPAAERVIEESLELNRHSVSWIGELKGLRERLFHETAVWLAVRIADTGPESCEFLLLTSSAVDAVQREQYVNWENLRLIFVGLVHSINDTEDWILARIDDLEANGLA